MQLWWAGCQRVLYISHSTCARAVKIIFLSELLVQGNFTHNSIMYMYKKSTSESRKGFYLKTMQVGLLGKAT